MNIESSNWSYASNILFGENRVKEIQKACNKLNISNPLIVTDPGILKTNIIEKIQDLFVDNPELDWQLYDDIRFNVPYLDDTYNAVLYTIKKYNNGRQ